MAVSLINVVYLVRSFSGNVSVALRLLAVSSWWRRTWASMIYSSVFCPLMKWVTFRAFKRSSLTQRIRISLINVFFASSDIIDEVPVFSSSISRILCSFLYARISRYLVSNKGRRADNWLTCMCVRLKMVAIRQSICLDLINRASSPLRLLTAISLIWGMLMSSSSVSWVSANTVAVDDISEISAFYNRSVA